MGKKFSGVSQTMSRFRGWIQAGATLLTNLHLPNFLKGGLYQGAGKTVCMPGLNCYSCPAASGACPIGAFQAVVGSSKFGCILGSMLYTVLRPDRSEAQDKEGSE